jgi:hypothetical protein
LSETVASQSSFAINATAGSGDFGSAATFAGMDNPVTVVVADVNADGRPDVVTTNILGETVSVSWAWATARWARRPTTTGKAPFGLVART